MSACSPGAGVCASSPLPLRPPQPLGHGLARDFERGRRDAAQGRADVRRRQRRGRHRADPRHPRIARGHGHLLPDRRVHPRNPDLVRRIAAAGHEVGNHTWSHPHLTAWDRTRRHDTLPGVDAALIRRELASHGRAAYEAATGSAHGAASGGPPTARSTRTSPAGPAPTAGGTSAGPARGAAPGPSTRLDWVADRSLAQLPDLRADRRADPRVRRRRQRPQRRHRPHAPVHPPGGLPGRACSAP